MHRFRPPHFAVAINDSMDFCFKSSSHDHVEFFDYIEDMADYIAKNTKSGLYIESIYDTFKRSKSNITIKYEENVRTITYAEFYMNDRLVYKIVRDPYDLSKDWNIEEL